MAVTEVTQPEARILLVEDDRLVRYAIARTLAGDATVDTASSAAEARGLVQKGKHLGWIVDLRLPDGSGLELIDWARGVDPHVPAMLITGLLDHDIINEVEARGVWLLAKPFDAARCRQFVERCEVAHTRALEARVDRVARAYGLSGREKDVLCARARGVPRAALEHELHIKETTVRTLIRRILQRTHHTNLDQLLDVVLRSS